MSSFSSEKPRNTIDEENGGGGASLPEDQVFELLTRVPLDDLAACRAVSTGWRSITYEPAFAPLHCRRAAAVSGFFLQTTVRNHHRAAFVSMHAASSPPAAISLDFLPSTHVRLDAVAAHRGLACCVDLDKPRQPRYYVCKPATRQWRALPNPRVRFDTSATAMAARPRSSGGAAAAKAEFKIVRFSKVPKQCDILRCEVFDSRRFAWRRAADVPVASLPPTPAVHAHGAAHWLRGGGKEVFAFDLNSEAWRLIALPREMDEGRYGLADKKISAVEGRLCLLVETNEANAGEEVVEVWEMACYAEGRWEKKITMNFQSLQAQEGTMILHHLYSSSDAVFLTGIYRAVWYDFRRGKKVAEVEVDQIGIQHVFKFESDVIPCQIGNVIKACHPPAAGRAPSKE